MNTPVDRPVRMHGTARINAPRRLRMERAMLLVLGSSFIGWVPRLWARPEYPELAVVAYCAIALVAAVAFRLVLYRDHRDVLLLVVSGLTFILYQKPLLAEEFRHQYTHRFSEEHLVQAAWYSLAGLAFMVLGYQWAKGLRVKPLLQTIGARSIAPRALARMSAALMLLSMLAAVFRPVVVVVEQALGRVVFLLDQLPLLAIAIGGLAILDGHQSKMFRVLLFGVFVPLEVCLVVARTLFYHLIVLFAPLVIMYALRRRKLPLVPVLVGALLLMPAFKARMEARIAMGYGDRTPASELAVIGFTRIVGAWTTSDETVLARRNVDAEARLNSLSLLSHVVREHETEGRSYKYGATFWWLPLTPIPRLIFPAKPKSDHGDSFPIEYGIKTRMETYAVVLPLLVESYINGGVAGVILINFAIGVAYFLCSAYFEHGRGTLNMVALVSVVALSVYVENNITLVFGAAIQAGVLWMLVDRLHARKRGQRTAGSPRDGRRGEKRTGGNA